MFKSLCLSVITETMSVNEFGLDATNDKNMLPLISEEWMQDDMRLRVQDENIRLNEHILNLHEHIRDIETRELHLVKSLLSVPNETWVTLQQPDSSDVCGFLRMYRSPNFRHIVFDITAMDCWNDARIRYNLLDTLYGWNMQSLVSCNSQHSSVICFNLQCGQSFTLCFSCDMDRTKFDAMLRKV